MISKLKLMIASDIHGSSFWCEKLLYAYATENPDFLLLLGDILYHGPRNDLPDGYAPKSVIAMLNPLADRIICVRGNCEAEVDQMVLDFPVLADYSAVLWNSHRIYATHGHVFGEDNPPKLRQGDILLCGHTHVPKCAEHSKYTYINPGSVSIPKESSPHSYMILEGNTFRWKTLDSGIAKTYKEYKI